MNILVILLIDTLKQNLPALLLLYAINIFHKSQDPIH
jgi:hypothetical protein